MIAPVSSGAPRFRLTARRSGWIGTSAVWLCIYGTKAFRASIGGRPGDVVLGGVRQVIYLGSNCLAWLALTIILFWLIEKRHDRDPKWSIWWSVPAIAAIVSCMVVLAATLRTVVGRQPFLDALAHALRFEFLADLLYVAVILAIGYGLRSASSAEQEVLATAQLQAALARADLAMISGKLHPQFITRALERVSETMAIDAALAQTLLAKLGEFLRGIMRHRARLPAVVGDELLLIAHLADFQRSAFPGKFTINVAVAPAARHETIPAFILHAVVQEAMMDAMASGVAGRQSIELSGNVESDQLRFELRSRNSEPPPEHALQELEHRLDLCADGEEVVRLFDRNDDGYTVTLLLPMRALGS